jgi:putative membrane protein
MTLLTPDASRRIAEAVKKAEANTGGEIVVAVIPESDDYASREMAFGIGLGVIAFVVMAFFAAPLEILLDRWVWLESPALLPLAFGAVSLGVGAIGYALAQIPAVDRLVIGRKAMADAVKKRALRHFVESAAYDTVDRTGVLLFVSALERRVELLADRGIDDAVAPDTWDRIVSALVRGLKDGRREEAMETAVEEIGTVLAEYVPRREDDENELDDGPSELGKGS